MKDAVARLQRVLNPRTVAVVGDTRRRGYMWLRNMSAFQGKVYSVQIDSQEIPGIEELQVPNYQSLLDIEDEIDYVVCAVPRAASARIVADCIKKGVGGVTLFTSGFAETGEEEGIRLQEQISQMAKEANLPLIGPNCMGLYNPGLGVRQAADQAAGEAGRVGLISQSGTHAISFSMLGSVNGVGLSKAISIGNAVVLDVPDYLEYLAADPQTEVIAMYLEGVRDGRRFFRVLRETAAAKPVVVWKGGLSEAGARAIASHTASLATSTVVWDALMRQCGAVTTDTLDETVDTVKAFLHTKPGTGYRVGLMAMTGGQSVVITDAFVRAGLEVPRLTPSSYEELASFFNIIGGSYSNPLDMGSTIGWGADPRNLERLLSILDHDEGVEAIAMEVGSGFMFRRLQSDPGALDRLLEMLTAHRDRSAKPFVAIMQPGHLEGLVAELRQKVEERGLPAYPSFERAAGALRRFVSYHRFRAGLD